MLAMRPLLPDFDEAVLRARHRALDEQEAVLGVDLVHDEADLGHALATQPPGHPDNCILRNRFKRGEPVGFRMFVADPSTQKREESAQLVVHVSVAGKTVDIPMRYRATAAQPEREFWVAKWVVPQDTPTGIIRYTVTATDKYGRTGEFRPFEVQASQLTIVD